MKKEYSIASTDKERCELKAPSKGAIVLSSFPHILMHHISEVEKEVTFIELREAIESSEFAKDMGYDKKTSGTFSGTLNRLVEYGHLQREIKNHCYNYTITNIGISELERLRGVLRALTNYTPDTPSSSNHAINNPHHELS